MIINIRIFDFTTAQKKRSPKRSFNYYLSKLKAQEEIKFAFSIQRGFYIADGKTRVLCIVATKRGFYNKVIETRVTCYNRKRVQYASRLSTSLNLDLSLSKSQF